MKHKFEIPPFLSHLKLDPRGYPIPYFVPIENGVPNFRLIDWEKVSECVERNRCEVCGKKLYKDYSYIIQGPVGMANQVSTDGPMHRVCAEFALKVCPHLFYQKSERKEIHPGVQPHIMLDKPEQLMLVKCRTKFKWKKRDEGIFGYQYVSHEVYGYVDGLLQKLPDGDLYHEI